MSSETKKSVTPVTTEKPAVIKPAAASEKPAPASSSSRYMRSSGPEQSVNRILDSTLEAISRQGLKHLSMSDICRFSGVARGTLYRYFPTKEAVLEGIAERVSKRFEDGLNDVCDPAHAPFERLSAVLNFLADHSREAKGDNILEVEPSFALEFIGRMLPRYSEWVSKALAPMFDEVKKQTGQNIDRLIWSNLLMRVNVSIFLLPPPDDSAEHFKQMLASTAFAMLGIAQSPPAAVEKKKAARTRKA
ncbi:TetR/AcrR family transcriptional regulator [Pseudomonas sp. LB3P14]